MSGPTLSDLRVAYPDLVWSLSSPAIKSGATLGALITVGRDSVSVTVQGIPGPAKSHDGTIAGVRKAVRSSLSPLIDVFDRLAPEVKRDRDAARERAHALANDLQVAAFLIDELYDLASSGEVEAALDVQDRIDVYRGAAVDPDPLTADEIAAFDAIVGRVVANVRDDLAQFRRMGVVDNLEDRLDEVDRTFEVDTATRPGDAVEDRGAARGACSVCDRDVDACAADRRGCTP